MKRALCVLAMLAAGCSGLLDADGKTGVKKIGPQGGDVKAQGAALHVPEGALSGTVQISIKPVTEGNPDGLVGTAFEISAADTTFAKPVELSIDFNAGSFENPDAPELARIAVLQDGEWVELPDSVVDRAAGVVRATTTHFSRYGVVQSCGNFRTCAPNQVCSRFRCRPVELCSDGLDNDRDGLVDCADADCGKDAHCSATCCFDTVANQCVTSCCQNGVCLGNCYCGSGWCSRCAGGGTESSCTDGVDNDRDGFVDCRDPDCASDAACTTREICNNGVDDDRDGQLDCADSDCASDPVACPSCCMLTIGNQCVNSCCQNGVCQGNCVCGPQVCNRCGTSSPEVCTDGIDNDRDGLVDCLDPDCVTSLSCRPQPTELNCADGIDNDRDGAADCQDSDCQSNGACVCNGSPGCCYPRCSANETLVCEGRNICGYPCHCEAALDAGTPSPSWFQTCGDPVCGGWRSKGIPLCSTERRGDPCGTIGAECDPQDSCNTLLRCATSDPRMGTGCPISRERFKEDIDFLAPPQLQKYHDELVSLPLATYRYKTQDDSRRHLGFIIDGHESMICVQPERDQVDVYGYTSMAVAAIKVQAAQIDELRKELNALKSECSNAKRK